MDIQQQQLKGSGNPNFGKSQEVSPPNRARRRFAGGAAREVQAQEGAEAQGESGVGRRPAGEAGAGVEESRLAGGQAVRGLAEGSACLGTGEAERGEMVRLEGIRLAEEGEQEIYRAALGFLGQVGVWPDAALRIATKLIENHRRGHGYLPSLADVLGWIAYCFGDGKKNNVDQPAALLAANLIAGRRCPEKYRPQPVCSACGFVEGFCECAGEPDYRFPEGFLDFALKHQDGYSPSAEYSQYYGARPTTIWGVCRSCHGFPCQCEED